MDFYGQLEDLIRVNSNGKDLTLVQILAEIGTPSTSIAILDQGEITTHCISGLDHDDETLFQACSISKAIANLAFTRLIEQGYFALDDKIIDRLPTEITRFLMEDPRTKEQMGSITIKHLMSHTAGLSVHGFHGYSDHGNVPSAMQIVEGRAPACTQAIKLTTIPGLEFMYSGGGIQLLQYMAEHATQRQLPDLVRAYVFEPLGMTRSFYEIDKGRERNFATPYFTGNTECSAGWHLMPELAAAGLWTTPRDLLKAVRGVQMSLQGRSGGLLSKTSAERMLTTIKSTMALSWFANSSAFGHSGSNDPGYECMHFGYADLPWNKELSKN